MSKKTNYIQTTIYLRRKQYKNILKLKKRLFEEHDVNISITELFRDSVDDFINQIEKEGIKTYLERKGW